MEIFKEIHPLKVFLKNNRLRGNSIGLVPTMGALHKGHLSLIEASKKQNQVTVCSIFVNPTQFNNVDDLQKYPRTIDLDLDLLQNTDCDAVFYPQTEEMYPEKPVIHFDFGALDKVMEGQFRPGHFSGVALVVSKLFNIVEPDNAYFGQKDWQQFAVIRKIVDELKYGLNLHWIPTVRERDGLAMSSRNQRLDSRQRVRANVFYQALLTAKKELKQDFSISHVKQTVKTFVRDQGAKLEYFEIADGKNLNVLNSVNEGENQIVLCIAGYIDDIRLIDNIFLD